jgi:hypothetical protein
MGKDQGGEGKESEVASSLVGYSSVPGRSRMNPTFERYIGIDYSGAETPESSLKGLRVYAADRLNLCVLQPKVNWRNPTNYRRQRKP